MKPLCSHLLAVLSMIAVAGALSTLALAQEEPPETAVEEPPQEAQAEAEEEAVTLGQTFELPLLQGYRLNYCLYQQDEGCGQEAATKWCEARGFGGGAAPTNVFDFRVLAIDRATGEVLWNKSATRAVPHERGQQTGSQASNSPVTDGRFL